MIDRTEVKGRHMHELIGRFMLDSSYIPAQFQCSCRGRGRAAMGHLAMDTVSPSAVICIP